MSDFWHPARAAPTLAAGGIHVWIVEVGVDTRQFDEVLRAEEIERASRFRFPEDRQRFVTARGAVRLLLGAYLGVPAPDVPLAFSEHGKPFLEAGVLHFNVSHAHTLALVAVSREWQVGVDVEWIGRDACREDTAAFLLHPEEMVEWRALEEQPRRERFFEHWVAKEAYSKATGLGIGSGLRELRTASLPARALPVPESYRGAVAWIGPGIPQIAGFQFAPGS